MGRRKYFLSCQSGRGQQHLDAKQFRSAVDQRFCWVGGFQVGRGRACGPSPPTPTKTGKRNNCFWLQPAQARFPPGQAGPARALLGSRRGSGTKLVQSWGKRGGGRYLKIHSQLQPIHVDLEVIPITFKGVSLHRVRVRPSDQARLRDDP